MTTMTSGCFRALILVATVFGALPAMADEPYSHDGFYLRIAPGLGGVGLIATDPEPGKRTHGAAGVGTFDLQLGGSPMKDLVVAGELHVAVGRGSGFITWDSIGIFVQGYLQPANVFIGGGIGCGALLSVRPEVGGLTMRVHFDVGREWWVSPRWAIGVGGRAELDYSFTGRGKDEFIPIGPGVVLGGGLFLSATFQ